MNEFFLQSATQAITAYPSPEYLLQQKERVEQAVVRGDTALVLDTAKALLESVLKTVISDRLANQAIDDKDMNQLNKLVKECLSLNRNKQVDEKLKKIISTIIHNVTELRNEFGAASHGDDAQYENPIQEAEAQMIANVSGEVVGLILSKHREATTPHLVRVYYEDYPDFNDWLDTQHDGYSLGHLRKSKAIC